VLSRRKKESVQEPVRASSFSKRRIKFLQWGEKEERTVDPLCLGRESTIARKKNRDYGRTASVIQARGGKRRANAEQTYQTKKAIDWKDL